MAHSAKKISRKDIRKPDQFFALSHKVVHFVTGHRTELLAALALLLAVLLGIWGWDSYRQRQERLAAQDYSRALNLYHAGRYGQAVEAFAHIKSYYRSTPYTGLSLLYQANGHLALGDDAKAAASLTELLQRENKDSLLRQIALISTARLQEKKGQCKEATASYAEAEKIAGAFRDEAMLGKARCSLQNQDLKGALNSYRQYLTSFPASERAVEISVRAQEIEGKIGAGVAGK